VIVSDIKSGRFGLCKAAQVTPKSAMNAMRLAIEKRGALMFP
jgi:hypothetical protein